MARDYQGIAERVARLVDASSTREARMRAVVDEGWDGLSGEGVSWIGFYVEDPGAPDGERLVLGPRRDKPACSPIGLHGVCGAAFVSGEDQLVRDVMDLGGDYVACDPRDRSEVVVALVEPGDPSKRWGVLDLDSFDVGAFDARDARGLRLVLEAAGLAPAPVSAPRARS